MSDLLYQADPTIDLETDLSRLRAKVDERIGLTMRLTPATRRLRRSWVVVLGSFALVIAFAVPIFFRFTNTSVFGTELAGFSNLPGIETVIPLASGGVQAVAVDGDIIWVVTSLQNKLQKVDSVSGQITDLFDLDAYVEGVVAGGGYLWLLSYENGGEVIRFNRDLGQTDMTIPLGGLPANSASWFGDRLWASNDQNEVLEISPSGEVKSRNAGELKGSGLGYLWVNDPETGLISSLSVDGIRGEIVIPTFEGLETMPGSGVRSVTEAGGYLWLMDGEFPWGTNLSVYNPETGDLRSFGGLTFGLLSIVKFDGALWLTSNTDHVLLRVELLSEEVTRYPLPGKPGGLVVADGSLWVASYQPGALLRLDPGGLIESGGIVIDNWDDFPHRFLCTGNEGAPGPTVILEPFDWVEYGSWSVIQAQLSHQGYLVCANGYLSGEVSPGQRADDLNDAISAAGLEGPFVLVAAGDGVHSIRTLAAERDDVVGVVLVDPMPLGFQDFYDTMLPKLGHPPWSDLDPVTSTSLGDFGDIPLVVIGQDPDSVFLSRLFVATAGREAAQAANQAWQDGLSFYSGLSSNTTSVIADGSGLDSILWSHADLVVEQVLELLSRQPSG